MMMGRRIILSNHDDEQEDNFSKDNDEQENNFKQS